MAEGNKFSKWQWITADAVKATGDTRPESYKLNSETIRPGEKMDAGVDWRARRAILRPLVRTSLCQIKREQEASGAPTLGIFRPAEIKKLVLEAEDPNWSPEQISILKQDDLFQKAPSQTLEKIPFKFKYVFKCSDAECKGHGLSCTDWEMAESYRRWRAGYGNDWEAAFRQKFESEMIEKKDTHFFVGTVHRHPKNWIIVGLFYPPKQATRDLFDLERGPMPIEVGSPVWGHYSGKPDSGQPGEYRGIVRQIRQTEDEPEYLVEYEDGIREWTDRLRPRS
jgi:hypothetical protein